jgi:hypothetical protein
MDIVNIISITLAILISSYMGAYIGTLIACYVLGINRQRVGQ